MLVKLAQFKLLLDLIKLKKLLNVIIVGFTNKTEPKMPEVYTINKE